MSHDYFSALPAKGNIEASRTRFQFCAAQNLLKHAVASELGGLGDQFKDLVDAHYQLGLKTQDPGLLLSLNAHIWGAIFPLIIFGTSEQRQDWLPGLITGDLIAGHAITEPGAGSDLDALKASAIKTESGFRLTGIKRYITNTPIADALLVYAKLDDRLTAFIVRKDDNNVEFTCQLAVAGCASATIGEVVLKDCSIPHQRQLGKVGTGNQMLQTALELERAFIFACIAGVMEWQLNSLIQFTRQRKVKGAHLGQQQAISHKLANMKVRLDTIKLWVEQCAHLKDQSKRISLASAQTKLFSSEAFLQSSLDAIQIMGASGLEAHQPMLALVQDALASRLFSGSSEIQLNIIAGLLGVGDGYRG